jgi:selenocysteine-specific translation elongation factor
MVEESKRAEFLVADHFEITGRGVVVLGKIFSGTFRAGMS